MNRALLSLAFFLTALPLGAQETNAPSKPKEEVVEVQGVKIWKVGRPAQNYIPVGRESLTRVTLPEAQNRIALAVRARKGNAAIITSMVSAPRLDITQNTGINRLDGLNVLYEIIQLQP